MYIWSVNSSADVFSNTRPMKDSKTELQLTACHNGTAVGKICMRYPDAFSVDGVNIETPDGVKAEIYLAVDQFFNDRFPYPDKLVPFKGKLQEKSHMTRIFWVVLRVGGDAADGEQNVKITFASAGQDFVCEWKLTVYPATLPEPKNSDFAHEYFFTLSSCFNGKFLTPKVCTPEWEESLKYFAVTMKKLRMNVLRLSLLELLQMAGSKRTENGWQLNFDVFDKVVDIFLDNGSFKYIIIEHMCEAVWGNTVTAIDENGKFAKLPARDPEGEKWLVAAFGGLYEHMKERGLSDMLMLHLEDEPHTKETWQWAREIVRRIAPDVLCCDALDTHAISKELPGFCDVYVPRFEVYAEEPEFYHSRKAAGDKLWAYCCCFPEDFWWLNHFIDNPIIYPRLIGWASFSQKIDGFLHWGFNFWHCSGYGVYPDARFKGDAYIVYPGDDEDQLYPTARYFASLEGVEENELLRLLEKKDPKKAYELSEKIAKSFDVFDNNPESIEAVRKTVLEEVTK